MQWENLTSPHFAKAVKDTGVCVFTVGVCERHGDHLPLGTDYLLVHRIACLAAEREPAVVFPPWYFGQILEAKCWPGAVALGAEVLLPLFEAVFDEIGRNGFRKILVVSGHGGNRYLVPLLAQLSLHREKPYTLYIANRVTSEGDPEWDAILETDLHWHACECETSISLAVHPELVNRDAIPDEPGKPLGRATHLGDLMTGVGWYANFPEHYAGDARPATAEKGEKLVELRVKALADYIAKVKGDEATPALEKEFFNRVRKQAEGK